jgi:hypothetical protein
MSKSEAVPPAFQGFLRLILSSVKSIGWLGVCCTRLFYTAKAIIVVNFCSFWGTVHFCQKVVNSSNSKHKHPSGFPDLFLKTSLENGYGFKTLNVKQFAQTQHRHPDHLIQKGSGYLVSLG